MKNQNTLNAVGFSNLGMAKVFLRKGEALSIHMDCLNQHGQLITIDDVQDMQGMVCVYMIH
jgi:hypothetical protein